LEATHWLRFNENKQRNWYYCHTPTLNALLYTFKHLPFVDRTLYFLHPCCLGSVPKYSFGQNCHKNIKAGFNALNVFLLMINLSVALLVNSGILSIESLTLLWISCFLATWCWQSTSSTQYLKSICIIFNIWNLLHFWRPNKLVSSFDYPLRGPSLQTHKMTSSQWAW